MGTSFWTETPGRNTSILAFRLFTSVEGPSVGSGMNLAIQAKNITPPKNCITRKLLLLSVVKKRYNKPPPTEAQYGDRSTNPEIAF